jgi:hypothetical protein
LTSHTCRRPVIQDGRVVGRDYAPDVAWLDTSLETTWVPSGTREVRKDK